VKAELLAFIVGMWIGGVLGLTGLYLAAILIFGYRPVKALRESEQVAREVNG